MITFHIPLNEQSRSYCGDLAKALSFAASDIMDIQLREDMLEVIASGNADPDELTRKMEKIVKQFASGRGGLQDEIIAERKAPPGAAFHDVGDLGCVRRHGDGLISLEGEAIGLLNGFDALFRELAMELGAAEMRYPTLLSLEAIRKTGYLRTSPQYSSFVSHPHEDIDALLALHKSAEKGSLPESLEPPRYVLSPSACFHCYMELEGSRLKEPTVITTRQNVFRNEGRLNWNEFGRLRDYEVRELVFIGSSDFVAACRRTVMERSLVLLEEMGLSFRLCAAHDPFVIPAMQRFKKIQLEEKSKYELQLEYAPGQYMSTASFNIHGRAFTDPFDIEVADAGELTATGCVGFGLDRWVLAALSQWGPERSAWPKLFI